MDFRISIHDHQEVSKQKNKGAGRILAINIQVQSKEHEPGSSSCLRESSVQSTSFALEIPISPSKKAP